MATRALFLFLAAGLLWITEVFFAIGLYAILERHYHAPAAALITACATLVLTGLFATIALWRRRRETPAFGASAIGLGTLSAVTRFAERHPFATVAGAAAVGVLQAVLMGRRR